MEMDVHPRIGNPLVLLWVFWGGQPNVYHYN
jgi:hypothetical protein